MWMYGTKHIKKHLLEQEETVNASRIFCNLFLKVICQNMPEI